MSYAQIIKNEPLEITFSYWDGSGHRRKVVVKKGDSINDFLKACRDTARASEIRSCHNDSSAELDLQRPNMGFGLRS